uniref:EH domain-containing protein n=1 Tax=Periophthalmus magnuspinnatus TaxID=409849 RepID=A0A3B3ZCE3_9GOBI
MQCILILGNPSIWAISLEERDKHDKKFDTLSPSMGYVSGEQAKKFFLQSGLPPAVLAEIWFSFKALHCTEIFSPPCYCAHVLCGYNRIYWIITNAFKLV